jgi:hypothetical protein
MMTKEERAAREARKNEFLKKFELLFPGGQAPVCGFYCGDGWFPLLEKLCTELEGHIKNSGLPIEEACFSVEQIKEKFGGLRFYVGAIKDKNLFEAVHESIRKAEDESVKTCETCGLPGKRGGKNWIATLCDSCRDKEELEKQKEKEKWQA